MELLEARNVPATVVISPGSVLTYTAALGEVNALVLEDALIPNPGGGFALQITLTDAAGITINAGFPFQGGNAPGVPVVLQYVPIYKVKVELNDQSDELSSQMTMVFCEAYGGDGNDSMQGSQTLGDTLSGGAGEDFITGEGGNDWLWGGLGKDEIHGRDGEDSLFAGLDDDKLYGENGNDDLYGGSGDDWPIGGWDDAGEDFANGEQGDDYVAGGAGDDHLYGDIGADRIYGGFGNDLLHAGADTDVDTMKGEGDFDTFYFLPGDLMPDWVAGEPKNLI
jgi:Ca2+-binding RTX toxin-like protein